ncbi:cyclic nucleotide-binding domain-containing protein [Haliovirga abyssi]|uniref:Cyclic nucleotide-binding domain-containing protein n=1 Tax=Haliovirga abyssi TaxID=2996794 RepID=A0AAU9DGY8_9FUSO|nr:cyclic nucleotide-binding domain-containing protein [Haliovirga abyssi]BDU50737.1 hypothetical protein HLVA_13060 [Haliovirga abyssi]
MKKEIFYPLIDIDKVVPIINRISIFGGLNDLQLYRIFGVLNSVYYKKDEIIFKQGDSPSNIYIINSGKVKLYFEKENEIFELIEFGVGSCFGETALIGIQPQSATAIATEDVELLIISKKALMKLAKEDKDIFSRVILNIARETCRRLSQAENVELHYFLKKKK